VRRVADVRAAVAADLAAEDSLGRLTELRPRTRQALTLAIGHVQADGAPALDTGHILGGIQSEGTNLALHVLRAVDVDLEQPAKDLGSRSTAEPLPADAADGVRQFSAPASSALQAAVTEAISLDRLHRMRAASSRAGRGDREDRWTGAACARSGAQDAPARGRRGPRGLRPSPCPDPGGPRGRRGPRRRSRAPRARPAHREAHRPERHVGVGRP
jgi:ATP-dependent Clp protease ATP-binding subunit ClpC